MGEAFVAIPLTWVNGIGVFGHPGALLVSKRGDWVNEMAILMTWVNQIAKKVACR